MPAIDIDFDAYKALTSMRETEATTYNDVIRKLLRLGDAKPAAIAPGTAHFDGVAFPEGSQFAVTYKGRTYTAEIKGGVWVGQDGITRKTPSQAASAITGNNVNGWKFWSARRPGETAWLKLAEFR